MSLGTTAETHTAYTANVSLLLQDYANLLFPGLTRSGSGYLHAPCVPVSGCSRVTAITARGQNEIAVPSERASGVSFTAPKAGGAAESTATHPPRESALPSRRTGPDSASTRLVDCRRQRAIAVYAAITVHHTSWVVYGPRL